MPVVNLNQQFINNGLICPPDKSKIEYADRNLPGFLVECTRASPGVGSYRLRYRDTSKRNRYASIGRTNVVDLEDARDAAKKLKAQIALGADPQRDKEVANAMPTLTEFFDRVCEHKRARNKRSVGKDEERFRLHIQPVLGNKRIDLITRHDVEDLVSNVIDAGKSAATANRVLGVVRHTLALAVQWEYLDRNVAMGVKQLPENNLVEHYLTDEELRRLLKVLKTDRNRPVCNAALWLLATGARLNEALSARWEHIDRERRQWLIPAANTKANKVRSVALSQAALDVLDQLGTEGKHTHLFVGRNGKRLTTIHKVWTRIRKEAGLPHLRIHDLRHNHASMLINGGRTLYEVQAALGHSNPSVTQRYAHLSTKTLQQVADAASDVIKGAMEGNP